ncbi:MAG: NAD(P)H-quinone oxidoreductase [Steroidobacteraceae bacterium]
MTTPGGPEVLKPVSLARPEPGAGEILVKVAAAGINRPDILQRQGGYPPPPGAPATPGLEIAGEVVALGEGVKRYRIGDRVCALVPGGGYAEFCIAAEDNALPIPAGLSFIEAAGIPETFFTVWTNVFDRAQLKRGETFLVHGGSSGIGAAAIQLAVARGAMAFATAGSEDKCRFCEELGATRAFNYKTQDFVAGVQEATQRAGVDVILDMIAGDYLNRNVDALATEGRLVMIATMGGVQAPLHALRVMTKRVSITGSTLRGRSVEYKQALRAQLLLHVWPLFASGQLRITIDRVFDFAAAPAAHAYMESSAHKGKILLRAG